MDVQKLFKSLLQKLAEHPMHKFIIVFQFLVIIAFFKANHDYDAAVAERDKLTEELITHTNDLKDQYVQCQEVKDKCMDAIAKYSAALDTD